MDGHPFNTMKSLALILSVGLAHSLEDGILNRIGAFSKNQWQKGRIS